jgi:polysaccharide export outer membrane protein
MVLHQTLGFLRPSLNGLTIFAAGWLCVSPVYGQTMEEIAVPQDSQDFPASAVPESLSTEENSVLLDSDPFPESYVLGPGDEIRVDIFNVPEFSGENGIHEVLVDGTLSIPLVGILEVNGMTLQQAQNLLTIEYAKLLTRPPELTVTLLSSRPVRVAIAGEVHRPGAYTAELDSDSTTGRQWPTLTKVIQEAGGITQQADIRTIEVRRARRNAPDAVMTVNLWDLIRTGDIDQDIRLRDGDTITIPTAKNPSPAESVAISDANFSPSEIPVQVVGEVTKPGTITVPANATLNQAILAAGGFKNSRARQSTVELVRLNPDGTVERRSLDVDLSVAANEETNPILRPNDVVMVDRNIVATAGDTLGVILNPLTAITAILAIFGL